MLRNQAGEAFIRALTMVVGEGDGAKRIQPVNCRQLPRTRLQRGESKDSARASEQVHRTTQVVTKRYAGIYEYQEGKGRKNNNKREWKCLDGKEERKEEDQKLRVVENLCFPWGSTALWADGAARSRPGRGGRCHI